jgi:hypothetical protein
MHSRNGCSVKAGSVFVHGRPLVTLTSESFPDPKPKSVEIGDLLILRTGMRGRKVVDRRALLLQAKKVLRFPAEPPDNRNQHYLYAHWPCFTYVKSGELNNETRHVLGPDLYNGAQYLLIPTQVLARASFPDPLGRYPSNGPFLKAGCDMTAQPSEPDLDHYRSFSSELMEFALGDAGKVFVHPPLRSFTRGWDWVIDDLTRYTAERISKKMSWASGCTGTRSGHGFVRDRLMLQYSFAGDGASLLWEGSMPTSLPDFPDKPMNGGFWFAVGGLPEQSVLGASRISYNGRGEGNRPPSDPDEEAASESEDGGFAIIEFVVDIEEGPRLG